MLLDELTASDRPELRSHLEERDVFDVVAAWVGHQAQQRGWSALSSDPVRSHRLFATLAIDQVWGVGVDGAKGMSPELLDHLPQVGRG
jgi:hypothetical protein